MSITQKESYSREEIEAGLLSIFGGNIIPVEAAGKIIQCFKGENYAMSQMGMMLYTNGYSLRGQSRLHRNGLVYCDGENIFGIGFFAREGEHELHPMIVAPQGPSAVKIVVHFIKSIREKLSLPSSVFIRHVHQEMHDAFINVGMAEISRHPWHPTAWREDEQYPNRICILNDLFKKTARGWNVRNLSYDDAKKYSKKARLAYNRFENFLQRSTLSFRLSPYVYLDHQRDTAQSIVIRYFESRRKIGGVIGSTPEDYFAIVHQQPYGEWGRNYFAYLGHIESETQSYPISFFAGERLGGNRVALYATLTSRFEEDRRRFNLQDTTGFTALPQYVYLRVMQELINAGVETVDLGGSETEGLDNQKKQLGGMPRQSHWAVSL